MTDHLRQIETPPQVQCTLREQPAPMLDWLAIAALRIDDRYQRPLTGRNWAAIRHIAENFDWCAFGPVLCAPVEGGLYAVIDGQHRVHAAALCGIERIPAMIVPAPPVKQALAFVHVNSGLRVSQHQVFRAELVAGNPQALAIRDACLQAGCEALTYHPSGALRKPRQITSIGFLRSCIAKGHGPQLIAALTALVAYDQKGRTALYTDYLLQPFVAAIVDTGIGDTATLVRALQCRDPFKVLDAASRAAAEGKSSVTSAKRRAMAMQIRNQQVAQ